MSKRKTVPPTIEPRYFADVPVAPDAYTRKKVDLATFKGNSVQIQDSVIWTGPREAPLGLIRDGSILVVPCAEDQEVEPDAVGSTCSRCECAVAVARGDVELFGKSEPPAVVCRPCRTTELYGEQLDQKLDFEFWRPLDLHTYQEFVQTFKKAQWHAYDSSEKLKDAMGSIQEASLALADRISYCQSCGTQVSDRSGRAYCQKCMRTQWRRAKN